jgi:2-oxoglutarate ferredoxin oxidoreductase subunit delta
MIQGRIVIDSERCKGCELCVGVCPQHVIRMAEFFNPHGYRPASLADPDGACTGCGVCAILCPDVAIRVYRQSATEPRTKNREPRTEGQPQRLSVLSSGEGGLS